MIDADLEPGQSVVSEGVQQMREDVEVSIVDPERLDGDDPVVARRDEDETR